MEKRNVKLVVFVPESHADQIRQVLGEAGAGKIGNYDFCSFSTKGVGRYRGNEHSSPTIGSKETFESVMEEKIEVLVPRDILQVVIEKLVTAHPYEEVAYDIYPIEN